MKAGFELSGILGSRDHVVAGLSGGVDSAVAAALLVERGYRVVIAHLLLRPNGHDLPEAARRVGQIARHLGVPFHTIDARESFRAAVIDYFVAEYAAGRTPNPCVICNRAIKFRLLGDLAAQLGGSYVATGHYARVRSVGAGYRLLRGADPHKDQSYFLHALTQAQLARAVFPVGDLEKREVRAMAERRGLPVAGASESHDICFLPGGDYRSFLAERAPDLFRPGPIRDSSGAVVGQHRGLPAYTIGQRKGLGIAASEPLYVVSIDPAENALFVGPSGELRRDTCTIEHLHTISGEKPEEPFEAEAQIRYRSRPAAVIVCPDPENGAHVRFAVPQRAIAPGQYLVLYDGDTVIGGGAISLGP